MNAAIASPWPPLTEFETRERGIVSLKAHVRLVRQPLFRSPVLWIPGRTLSRTARFVNAVLKPMGLSLEHTRNLDALEFLLREGRLNDRIRELREYGMLPQLAGGAELGDYGEQEIMEHIFRNTAIFTPPANVYVGLNTSDPTDADSGTEVSGGSYGREAVNTTTGWAAPGATGGSTNNVAAVTFTTATANWGTVGWVKLMDAVSAGNLFFHSPVDTSKAINTDDTAEFAASALVATIA